MIFLDANVFMYAAGVAHPHKQPSAKLLHLVAEREVEAMTNAEVFQEILHRYRALGRWDEGKQVFFLARQVVSVVEPVNLAMLAESVRLLDTHPGLMARDGLHAATCILCKTVMCSYDTDFDVIPRLRRLTPDQVLAQQAP